MFSVDIVPINVWVRMNFHQRNSWVSIVLMNFFYADRALYWKEFSIFISSWTIKLFYKVPSFQSKFSKFPQLWTENKRNNSNLNWTSFVVCKKSTFPSIISQINSALVSILIGLFEVCLILIYLFLWKSEDNIAIMQESWILNLNCLMLKCLLEVRVKQIPKIAFSCWWWE